MTRTFRLRHSDRAPRDSGRARWLRQSGRAIIFVLAAAFSAIAVAQPSPDVDPWGPPTGGSSGSQGSGTPSIGSQGPGSAGTPGTGSQDPGTPQNPGTPGTGSQNPSTPGPGSQGPGSAGTPGTGSQGPGSAGTPGTGSQNPGTPGTGSAGSGAAGSGSGSGPRIIQVPTDVSAPMVSAAASPTVVKLGNKFTVFITAT
jgi:hypothetical protein